MKAKIVTPTLTMFNQEGAIDYEGNRTLIRHLVDNGVDGVVPLGSTGEFTILPFEERKQFLEFYLKEIGGAVKVLPGTGCINHEETIKLSNFALQNGADGVLVIGQYYYGISQEEIFHYYDFLASRIEGSIYLYNFPARTNSTFEPETVLRLLRKHKNIVGMKESVSSFTHTRDILDLIQEEFPDFQMYSGFDDQFLDNIDYGGEGSIGAISNLLPELWAGWVKARNMENWEDIIKYKKKIHKLMRLYQLETNCSGLFKEVLKARGLDICPRSMFPFDQVRKESVSEALSLIESVE
ncbi:dihydrodipicolinate synthase family protein [Lacrimispora sp.]|uniref:dihydrodipicolinate synthase family protein n=1 Tax=Lacrimispora sp. TaxID=2719234 RepID=UPI00345F20BF